LKATMKKEWLIVVLGLLMPVIVGPNHVVAGTFNISGPAGFTVDQVVGEFFYIDLNVLDQRIITDLNVSIELLPLAPDGGNPWDDLRMTLRHGTTTVTLHDNPTGFGPNQGVLFDMTFDDQASALLSSLRVGAPPLGDALGDFQPDPGQLSDFDGMNLTGIWTLGFEETCCPWETIIGSWSISGTAVPIPSDCEDDFEPDGDVDGVDLATIISSGAINIDIFAEDFGRVNCP